MLLNMDIKNKIVAKRIKLTEKERKSYKNWTDATKQLRVLKETCTHEHAIITPGYQGGGIYYCECSCPECGRNGVRYVPQYHMYKNNDWYKNYPQNQITLDQAIAIGERIGRSLFDSDYWWGEVNDYDKQFVNK